MNQLAPAKQCLCCGKNIRGRSDKKFCDDTCRNGYHNTIRAKAKENSYITSINNTLWKNRKILEQYLVGGAEERKKVHQLRLLKKGFDFEYFTHQYKNKRGNVYHFCYDYGYLYLDENWVLLVKRKEQQIER